MTAATNNVTLGLIGLGVSLGWVATEIVNFRQSQGQEVSSLLQPQTFRSMVYHVRQDEDGQEDHVTGLRFTINGVPFGL